MYFFKGIKIIPANVRKAFRIHTLVDVVACEFNGNFYIYKSNV